MLLRRMLWQRVNKIVVASLQIRQQKFLQLRVQQSLTLKIAQTANKQQHIFHQVFVIVVWHVGSPPYKRLKKLW